MSWVDVPIQPGVRAFGTDRTTKGYYRDASLVRWNPNLQPVGGWTSRSASAVTGKGRAVLPWKDNSNARWIGVGTEQKLYVMTSGGALSDITPTGFVPGRATAVTGAGFGAGLFGAGLFGTPRPDPSTVNPASVWTLDILNGRLVGCMEGDGKLYRWDLDPTVVAAKITNSPASQTFLVATEENILLCGAQRKVSWSDQGNETVWTPAADNQAGDLDLNTPGTLVCARKVSGQTLIFTTVDLWAGVYQGPPVVYGFQRRGQDCGPVSKGSPVVIDAARCVWMSEGRFFVYNGYVEELPCDVIDQVFADINLTQISKVSGWNNAAFGEVWWLYPSAGSTEVDRYVFWSYKGRYWNVGALARLSGASAGVFSNPILIGNDGIVYNHETGEDWDDAVPFAQTGPIELGSGDRRVQVSGLIPDERTLGNSRVSFSTREAPNLTATTYGPYSISTAPVDLPYLSGRQVEMKVEFLEGGARWGAARLDITSQGRR